jgi:hypothetical protein
MTDELMLSASSTNHYWRCHHAWYLNYVMRIPSPGNLVMALGQAVHAAIERFWTSPLMPVAALTETFNRETEHLAEEKAADAEALADGMKMLSTYIREVSPGYHPTIIERKFTVRMEGVLWTGILDNADDEDVRDIKTTSGKTINGRKPSFDPSRYDIAMTGYSVGYESITGRPPKRRLLDVLKRSGKYQQYERPLKMGDFIDTIRLTSSAIMQRDFSPTGLLNGSCASCPYFTTGDCVYV